MLLYKRFLLLLSERIQHKNELRGVLWDLTKPIWKRSWSCGLICNRFDDLTLSNQKSSSDFLFERPITCFVLIIWQFFFVRRFEDLTKFEPKSLRICQIPKTANNWSLSNHQNEARDWFFEEKLIIWHWFEFVKFRKRMHIRPRDNRIFQMDFVKFHWQPRSCFQ